MGTAPNSDGLKGQWGVVDVQDCVAAVQGLAAAAAAALLSLVVLLLRLGIDPVGFLTA